MFLSYFHVYVKMKDFWHSWSPAGFLKAAKLLDVSEEFLPHTTNHLESFNHHIKSCYFASYQHSGQLPYIDVWVLVLITKVFSFLLSFYPTNLFRLSLHFLRSCTPNVRKPSICWKCAVLSLVPLCHHQNPPHPSPPKLTSLSF